MIPKTLPIGIDDFKKIIVEDYYFIDKTEMIKDLLTYKTEVTLITRPRRFGKTLNMSMLRYFFEKTEPTHHSLFQNLKISKDEDMMKHCGRYPVLFLTLKDVKCNTWQETYELLKELIRIEYEKHRYLLEESYLSEEEKMSYKKILKLEGNNSNYVLALSTLSSYLERYHKEKVIILIDEYDTPIDSGFHSGFYEQVVSFFRNFFSAALKGNSSLKLSVLTGIIRVSKESIFSGLNNISVFSVIDEDYCQYFGFTQDEVTQLTKDYDCQQHLPQIKAWYNGYQFGDLEIYNPWSILNFLRKKCVYMPYWVNTSSNLLIHKLLKRLQKEQTQALKSLLEGSSIETIINPEITYKDIEENHYNSSHIYSFLLACGYLKTTECNLIEGEWNAIVSIPNEELYYIFKKEILNNLSGNLSNNNVTHFLEALLQQETQTIKQFLEQLLLESISNFDTLERFYHGLMLGLVVSFREYYQIRSNRESGEGRYDLMLLPKEKEKPGILFEFKIKEATETLEHAADRALKQIQEKKYDTELLQAKVSYVIKYGIAFDKKKVAVKVKQDFPQTSPF